MEDPDWEAAPTVYRYVVENAVPPIIDHRDRPTGVVSGLWGVVERHRAMCAVTEVLDRIFLSEKATPKGPDGSVTRMIVEIFQADRHGTARFALHLLLWNGTRVTVEIHRNPYPDQWNHVMYAVGIRPKDDEWTWDRNLRLTDVRKATRRNILHPEGAMA